MFSFFRVLANAPTDSIGVHASPLSHHHKNTTEEGGREHIMRSKLVNIIAISHRRYTKQATTPSYFSSSRGRLSSYISPEPNTTPRRNIIDAEDKKNPIQSMITLHHLENSQSFRIVWLLEELQMEYELKTYKRTKEMLAPEEYKAISPLGTSPTITTTNDDGGEALCESNAIMEYILDLAAADNENTTTTTTQQLRPSPRDPTRRQYLFWFHTSPGSLMPLMVMDTVFRALPDQVPCLLSPIMKAVQSGVSDSFLKPRLFKILDVAEEHLSRGQGYLAGGSVLTAADITMIYGMESASDRYATDFTNRYPKCLEWLDRIRQRSAFQTALKKVGETHVAVQA